MNGEKISKPDQKEIGKSRKEVTMLCIVSVIYFIVYNYTQLSNE